jgi:type IV pilus assembly protein PilA
MNKNKGFSLVELIVVVAIMAVLVGILAPAYLSYVEKTRRGTDENMAEEVRHTIEISAADICVYDELKGGATFAFSHNTVIATVDSSKQAFTEAMTDTYSAKKFEIKSKKYTGKTYTVTVTAATTGSNAALDVTGAWS